MKRFFKILKRIFLVITVITLIAVITAFFAAKQIEGKIKDLFVGEINNQLNTEVSVGDIRFTFLETFPYATLKFIDVAAKDAVNKSGFKKDTLLKAGNIMLNFNLLDIYRGNYKIKRIDITDARIKLAVYKDLSDNFHLLKPAKDTADKKFSFQLQRIILKRVTVSYRNSSTLQDYSFQTNSTTLKGEFSDLKYELRANGEINIRRIKSGELNYVKDKLATIDLNIAVNQQTGTYWLSKGTVDIGELRFNAKGNLTYTDKKKNVSASVISKEADLSELIAELPEHLKSVFKEYEPKGQLAFSIGIKGAFGGDKLPQIETSFKLTGGTIKNLDSKIRLENLDAEGVYENGSSEDLALHSIRISKFSGKINNSAFNGSLFLKGFRDTEIETEFDADMNLADLFEFIIIKDLEDVSGHAKIKAAFKGHIADLSHPTVEDFINNRITGEVRFENINGRIKDKPADFSGFSGDWDFSNNDIIVKSSSGKISNCDIRLKGYFKNIIPYFILPEQHLQINASLSSKSMDLDRLLAVGVKNNDTSYSLNFPKNIDFDINIDFDKLNFRKFNATEVLCSVKYRNSKLYLNNLSLNAFGGDLMVKGSMDGSKKNLVNVSVDAVASKTDIHRLFYELANFGQNYILAENLKGTANIRLQIQFSMTSGLKILPASILASSDMNIVNGELINYKPIYGMGKFIRVDDLSRIKFSEMKNQLIVKDSKVIIPEMDVQSDALNFSMSGTHTFRNEINYKIRLLLSDILFKKARAAKKENTEFGIEEADAQGRTTLYVLLTGTVDKPIFKYDSKSVKGKIVADLLNEKQSLKNIFKSEFSKSQKEQDSIKVKEKEQLKRQEKGEFIVEWEGVAADSALLGKKKQPTKRELRKEQKTAVRSKKDAEKPVIKVDWE